MSAQREGGNTLLVDSVQHGLPSFMAHTILNNQSSADIGVGYYNKDGTGIISWLAPGEVVSYPVPVFCTKHSPMRFPLTVRYEITEHGDAVQVVFTD